MNGNICEAHFTLNYLLLVSSGLSGSKLSLLLYSWLFFWQLDGKCFVAPWEAAAAAAAHSLSETLT